jgi:hypothetical protein
MTIFENASSYKLTLITVSIAALLGLIAIAAIGSLFVYVPYLNRVGDPKADQKLRDLETQFRLIAPPPNVLQRGFESSHKIRVGGISADYKTDMTYAEIRAHYDMELRNQGWSFNKERPVTIWWHDYGGKEAIYCKGIYAATLQYSGHQPGVEWTYHFGLSWGVFDECR